MKAAIDETARRRRIQGDYNAAHGIVPMSIKKDISSLEYADGYVEPEQLALAAEAQSEYERDDALEESIKRLEVEMKAAAKVLEFERAAAIRNRIRALKLKKLEMMSED